MMAAAEQVAPAAVAGMMAVAEQVAPAAVAGMMAVAEQVAAGQGEWAVGLEMKQVVLLLAGLPIG